MKVVPIGIDLLYEVIRDILKAAQQTQKRDPLRVYVHDTLKISRKSFRVLTRFEAPVQCLSDPELYQLLCTVPMDAEVIGNCLYDFATNDTERIYVMLVEARILLTLNSLLEIRK